MTSSRTAIQDFSTANKMYVNATVTFYTVLNGAKTSTLASLYSGLTGDTLLANPQTLDGYGKFRQPVYIEEPVIISVTGLGNTPDHDTGVINLPFDTEAAAGTVTDTDIVFTGDIPAAARNGYVKVIVAPPSNSTNFSTNLMRITEVDLSAADIIAPGHVIGGYDYVYMYGDGDCYLTAIHEAKLKDSGTGTRTLTSFYKPAIDDVDGDHDQVNILDCDIDFSGISGSVGVAYSVWSPRTDILMKQAGGILTDAVLLVNNYTFNDHDSHNVFLMFAGAPKTITVPHTLSKSFQARTIQGDANQISYAGSGGILVLHKDSHTKSEKQSAVVDVTVAIAGASGVAYISGDTAA